jgi:ABC-2 type transport system ATP-binding protein
MAAIEIKDLFKQYPKALVPAVDHISFSIADGIIAGLLGPNGAGKSTTLNIIGGLIHPSSGSVKVLGKRMPHAKDEVQSHIGFVPQTIALFGELSAWDNFYYIGQLYNLTKSEIKKRATQYLDALGLIEHADKRIIQYSGGMQRRANLIASLLHQPSILILDEPTAGVDIHSRAMLIDFIKQYNAQGHTVVYTSHNLDEAKKICEQIVIIDHGKVVVEGATQALIADTEKTDLEGVFLHYTGYRIRD